MDGQISRKLDSAVSLFESHWDTAFSSFKDEKAAEFASRFYKPLQDEARLAVKWIGKMENEIDNALQFCNQPLP